MRTILRLAALFVALVTLVLWLFGGPNTGFTKTSVMVKTIEPVTEREIITWEKRFLPGVEFLGAGLLAGALLFGASFLFRTNPSSSPKGGSQAGDAQVP
jgi:hypothetical protein